ncbi:MAG: SIS domain-containing protein [Saprospiraceae bacterium]|nr:SIS domain-containing protein [Saprospiraceae bacterium]
MRATIAAIIQESIAVKQALAADEPLLAEIEAVAKVCIETCRRGGKLLFCGNGGSAADAQHIAAELSGRFKFDRPPLYAEALHVNTSYLTAVANDYGYDETFARMVRAAGRSGDILFAISTSGNSANILRAAQDALSIPMTVVALTGAGGGQLGGLAQHRLAVPSTDTARIQECHILMGHILCGLIEDGLFG